MSLEESARELSAQLLADALPRRWAHTQGVAAKARSLAPLGLDIKLLEAAAWLHDIGYSPAVVSTGFHSLDGARYLRGIAFAEAVQVLVAHHSCATFEAQERDLLAQLCSEFPIEKAPEDLHTALTFCDMTTGPDGSAVPVEARLAEILTRYAADDVVHRAIDRASSEISSQCTTVDVALRRLTSHPSNDR